MRVVSPWYHYVVKVSAVSFTLSLVSLAAAAEDQAHVSAILGKAYQQTAAGDLTAAESTYRELVGCCPESGYPALARFLAKSGQTTATEALLTTDPGLAAQPPLVKARALVSAGRKSQAVALLKDAAATSGSLYAATLLLANQLETLGENDAAAQALEATISSPELADADRRDLFLRLVKVGGPQHLQQVLPQLVESVVTSSSLGYLQVRSMALDGLTALSMGPGYADFHAKLEQAAPASAPAAWLYALSCMKKGDDPKALATLETLSTGTMTPRQQAICLEELARMVALDTPRAIALYEQLITVSDDADRIRLNLAQQQFRAKNFAKAVELLKPMDFEKLADGDQQTALNLYLTSLGVTGPMPELVSEFIRLSANLPYEKVRDISSAPFILFSPDNLQALRDAVESKTAATSGSENAFIMLMGLENQIGNEAGISAALEKYVEVRPNEADAARELANTLAAKAWRIVAANPGTSPSLEVMESEASRASKALWNAIRLRPYTPEPYIKLIALYKLYNQPEKARDVPKVLSERPNATAEEIHLAAYIYATQGYPELSLPLYERALSLQDETRFRLNYAAALGRVGRYDDAIKIYRQIIEHGVNGHQYHIHEVHSSALALSQLHDREQEHLAFLNGLLNNPKVPDRDEFLLEEGKVLASAGLYQEALKFFYKYKEEFPADSVSATDIIVSTYAVMKDFETARKLLNDEISRTTNTEQVAFLRNNLALTYRLEGQPDVAVAQWQKLAADMPAEKTATRALLNAARALSQTGRINQARDFYNRFLALNTGDVTFEQIARDELIRLDRMEVPSDMLVQSAMLEYGPANVDHDHGPGFDLGEAKDDAAVPAEKAARPGALAAGQAAKEEHHDDHEEEGHDDHDDHDDDHDDHDADHGEMRPLRLDLGQQHDTTSSQEILNPGIK